MALALVDELGAACGPPALRGQRLVGLELRLLKPDRPPEETPPDGDEPAAVMSAATSASRLTGMTRTDFRSIGRMKRELTKIRLIGPV